VFQEGRPATSYFVVLSGSIKLVQLTEDGEAVVFRLLGRGDAFGTVSILGDDIYPVTVTAVTPVDALEWPAAVMRQLVDEYPALALNVLRGVSNRLQSLRTQYRQLATERVERRLARALVTLAQRAGTGTHEGTLIDVPLTREDLAQLTGTTIFTASRVVSRWESTGILTTRRHRLLIRKLHILKAVAGVR
jgi:CRP-like cAMP-binding protein